MKPHLLHPERDFDFGAPIPPQRRELARDLDLDTLVDAMAAGDSRVAESARAVLLSPCADLPTLAYRQALFRDACQEPSLVREIYDLATSALAEERKVHWGFARDHPDSILHGAMRSIRALLPSLHKLSALAANYLPRVAAPGWQALLSTLRAQLADEYLALVQRQLKELEFPHGLVLSARLGAGMKGVDYVLRSPSHARESVIQRMLRRDRRSYSFTIHERDEGGWRAVAELRQRGINPVANALAQSAEHMLAFFAALRAESAFYVGCLNLYEELGRRSLPTCLPVPLPAGGRVHEAHGLYDPCLPFRGQAQVVGNRLHARGTPVVVITGANQGGKTTFLRSVGLAQLMMQAGMFAPAQSFRADVCDGIFTHFRREEDEEHERGKFEEELARLSAIVDELTPHSLLLLNESFATTNEREGSEIAGQVVAALVQHGVKVFYVTHFHELADRLAREHKDALFLRAERTPDGRRTFQLVEGKPLPTSFGEDLFRSIFQRS